MKSSFQTILIIIFIVGFVAAIAIFSGLFSSSSSKTTSTTPTGNVVVWGILPAETMQSYVDNFNSQNYGYTLSYSYHAPANFYQDLIVSLANGKSPDLVITSSEAISQIANKLYTIPFAAYTERTFRDTNVDGAQMFLSKTGVTALPLLVDPLVVYYNKDILAAKNFVAPPKTWKDLQASVPLFTKRTSQGKLTQSTIAMGEWDNILHARDILSALFLQTGNSIVGYDATTGANQVTLANGTGTATVSDNPGNELPAVQALTFYTSFSDPTSSAYSWNNSLPESLQNFLAGKSVFYIGRASELFTIQAQNPNLNFDVTQLFQAQNATRPITFGSFVAVGIMKGAPNMTAAYAAATQMTSSAGVDDISKRFSLPPARRDLLQVAQSSPYVSVFFQAALSAFSWPDPNPTSTNTIFHDMINNVNSNTTDVQTAIFNATQSLQSTTH
ncbi:MAG TPA: extracellular solute-binding protein [Candidatus Paceibacterota bacterium]|jgi:ABC-type glycerol-3-phosphate transport system substrate-binding protein|nr:extracellular solute-binding protein [Candidatus Paceibacterota bacterium]